MASFKKALAGHLSRSSSSMDTFTDEERPLAGTKEDQPLDHSDEESQTDRDDGHRHPVRRTSRAGALLVLPWWKLLFVVFAVWGFFDVARRTVYGIQQARRRSGSTAAAAMTASPPGDYGDLSWYCRRDCGKSWDSALAKGYVFDELEFRFTHPECIDADNQADFLKSEPGPDGKWLYGLDVDWRHEAESHGNIYNGTNMRIVDSDELRALVAPGLTVWHSNLWHISHCLWYWKKASLARFKGTLLPMQSAEEAEHSYHCTRMIINYLNPKHLTDQYKTSFSF